MSSSTSSPKLRLGWIGLGSMGLGMAENIQKYLAKKEYPALQYTNRTIARGEPLAKIGGVPRESVADLVQNSDVVFISVSNDEALTTTIASILSSTPVDSKIIVDTTTVHPTTTTKVSEQFATVGGVYVAAPVFGATPLAQSGQLLIALAGPQHAIEIITPFLKGVIARNTIMVDEDPSKALLLKTTSNFITAGLMYLISEAHVLAEKSGLSASVLESLIQENFGAYAHGVSKRMTQGVYYPAAGEAPFSSLELGIKDVGHGLGIAKDVDMELKLAELAMGSMLRAKNFGDDRERSMDSSSIFGAVRQNAGLDFETDGVKRRDAQKEG